MSAQRLAEVLLAAHHQRQAERSAERPGLLEESDREASLGGGDRSREPGRTGPHHGDAVAGPGWRQHQGGLAAGARVDQAGGVLVREDRSEEHTSELQSLMRISYAVFCLKKKRRTPSDLHQGICRTPFYKPGHRALLLL